MAKTYFQLYKVCSRCLGSGVDPNGVLPESCTPCAGTGKVAEGWIDLESVTKNLKDIEDLCKDIWNKVK